MKHDVTMDWDARIEHVKDCECGEEGKVVSTSKAKEVASSDAKVAQLRKDK